MLGIDFKMKNIQVNKDMQVKMQIWDTAGSEKFRSVTHSFFKNAQAVVLVYSCTDYSCSPYLYN